MTRLMKKNAEVLGLLWKQLVTILEGCATISL